MSAGEPSKTDDGQSRLTVGLGMEEFDALLGAYWDAAYAEGKEGRAHDTFDCVAARTLAELHRVFKHVIEQREYQKHRANVNYRALCECRGERA